jgi:hypothetical protein
MLATSVSAKVREYFAQSSAAFEPQTVRPTRNAVRGHQIATRHAVRVIVPLQAGRHVSRGLSTSAAALASHQRPYTELYLHKSRIPTMHFQASMPRLAIPELNETLDK